MTEEKVGKTPIVDIAIPCYDANGRGEEALSYAFKSIKSQTYKNYKVVIADQSKKGEEGVWRVCNDWRNILPIHYFKNNTDIGNASSNFNFLFDHCTGDYIKPLCQDDFFLDENSLEILIEEFSKAIEESGCNWLASAYCHAKDRRDNLESIHLPKINNFICLFNTIGTPSGIILKGRHDLIFPKFDTELKYYYDCDFYFRFIQKYGMPSILKTPTIVNFLWGGSTTSGISQELIHREENYVGDKYGIQG